MQGSDNRRVNELSPFRSPTTPVCSVWAPLGSHQQELIPKSFILSKNASEEKLLARRYCEESTEQEGKLATCRSLLLIVWAFIHRVGTSTTGSHVK